ncbi:hypothetical protein [Granulicella sibirica]|nr:hypothetical protein [Granulicella sibirica]
MAYSMNLRGLVLGAVLAIGLPVLAQDGGGQMGSGNGFAGGQRVSGTVTAVAGDKLTVKSETGDIYQVVTTTNTRVMKDRQPIKLADIPVGSGVGAMGLMDAPTKTVHAMFVMVVDPEQVKKAREGLGKVYIMGKVEKIEETTLTILRSDGVTQKIEVDEGTSFKRGRGTRMGDGGTGGPPTAASGEAGGRQAESITLLDIKVGDNVGGPGALKNGVFVAKELGVMSPGTGRRRRGADGAGAAEGAPANSGTGQTQTPQ